MCGVDVRGQSLLPPGAECDIDNRHLFSSSLVAGKPKVSMVGALLLMRPLFVAVFLLCPLSFKHAGNTL